MRTKKSISERLEELEAKGNGLTVVEFRRCMDLTRKLMIQCGAGVTGDEFEEQGELTDEEEGELAHLLHKMKLPRRQMK